MGYDQDRELSEERAIEETLEREKYKFENKAIGPVRKVSETSTLKCEARYLRKQIAKMNRKAKQLQKQRDTVAALREVYNRLSNPWWGERSQ